MSDREYDLVVVGATGFVGRLLAGYLSRSAPPELRIALAGRSRERLEGVRRDLPDPAHTWPLLVVDVTDPKAVAGLAAASRVVVTTVGPYARYGLPLARACADAGTHYADLTGEVLFVRELVDTLHERAVDTGARIVPSCGFDSVPSDLAVHALWRQAERLGAGGLGDTTLLVTQMSGGFSGGTIDSMRAQLEAVEAEPALRRVVFDPFALSADRSADGDARANRDQLHVFRDATTGRWTAPFVMAPFNTRVVRRSDSLREHAYGPRFRYREAVGFGRGTRGRVEASGLTAGLGAVMAAMGNRRVRPLVDRVLPAPGEGPSERVREQGRFRVEVRSTKQDGTRMRAVVAAKGDPGYAATSVMLGESALALAGPADRLWPQGGVLTPAVAMGDVLTDRLRAAGFRIEAAAEG